MEDFNEIRDVKVRADRQRMWEKYLDSRYCSAQPITENRPCDNGAICDRCQSKDAVEGFNSFLRKYNKEHLILDRV